MAKELTRADILDMAEYRKIRRGRRRSLLAMKKHRRVPVGPYATFHFENYETMWFQVHEMLFIEKGGEDQIPDELKAYNPLIPDGRELVATLMFEIDNSEIRRNLLARLGGVEKTCFLRFGDHRVAARAEADIDRTTADGKASSVQFLHFGLSAQQIAEFSKPAADVVLGISHPAYAHMTVLPEASRIALAGDFD